MHQDRPANMDLPGASKVDTGLAPNDQRVVDHVLTVLNTTNRVFTEEMVVRTRGIINGEIQTAFTNYTRLTTKRKIVMAIAGAAAFGLGFLVKGWLIPQVEESETNGTHE